MKNIAIIVTYNRYKLLIENLIMLEKQSKDIDKIIIVDNHSTDNTESIIKKKFKESKLNIEYRYMNENYGGAGGFYYGVKFAYEDNADFIWMMDDDGKPYDEYTFERITNAAKKLYKENKLLFLNSLVTTNGKNLSFGFFQNMDLNEQIKWINNAKSENILRDYANPFNGTLISKELVEKIGYPRKEFFISRDETDYMYRSKKANALLATITDSIYCHPKSKLKYKKIGKIKTQIYNDLDKEYYFIRNLTYTYKDNDKKKILKFIMIRILTIILYEDKKIKRLKQVFKAKNDAYKNIMGKRV